ncbi:hypothetical protein ASZ90_005487 [hydrocarbon metagenome]|uniref:Uncharacterized protein n=1 Tax=hydrocarbon metagenome TaxID=938273 RepID=A0A0W8FUY3_9ZZZZ
MNEVDDDLTDLHTLHLNSLPIRKFFLALEDFPSTWNESSLSILKRIVDWKSK